MSLSDKVGVEVAGDATGVKAAMLEAEEAVKLGTAEISGSFEAMAGVIEAALGPLVAMTVAFAAFHEITETINQTVELAQQLKIMSEKTGIAAEELSALTYAAKLSEVQVDQLGIGLQRLARNMESAAKTGKGPAADAFADLGIKASTAGGQLRPMRDILLDLADRFQSMPDGPRKAALAMDLFGRSGANLIPMLNRGKQGIEDLEAEARRLGVTMSGENITAALEYEEAMKKLRAVWDGFLRTIVVDALPVLEKLVQLFSALVHAVTAAYQAIMIMQAFAQLRFGDAKAHAEAWLAAIKAIPTDFTERTPAQTGGTDGNAPPITTEEKSKLPEFEKSLAAFKDAWLTSEDLTQEELLQKEASFWKSRLGMVSRASTDYGLILQNMHAADRQRTLLMEADWKNAFESITRLFSHAMDQMIRVGGGFREFWRSIWYDLVAIAAAAQVQMLENHYAHELAKKNITLSSVEARIAAESWGALKTVALKMWEGIQWIGVEAAKAAASAWASIASIPVVGPFLAPGVALAALAGVMALAGRIHSAEGGFDIPSGMNPMTQLHANEMVLPKEYADVIRNMAGGGGGGGDTYHVHIRALDAADVSSWATRNKSTIAAAAYAGVRSGKHLPGTPGRGPA